jgi:hypothetical protein
VIVGLFGRGADNLVDADERLGHLVTSHRLSGDLGQRAFDLFGEELLTTGVDGDRIPAE